MTTEMIEPSSELSSVDAPATAAVTLVLVPLVLLMKRSIAEKGAHISQE